MSYKIILVHMNDKDSSEFYKRDFEIITELGNEIVICDDFSLVQDYNYKHLNNPQAHSELIKYKIILTSESYG